MWLWKESFAATQAKKGRRRKGGSSLWLGEVAGLVSGSKQSHLLCGLGPSPWGGISDGVLAAWLGAGSGLGRGVNGPPATAAACSFELRANHPLPKPLLPALSLHSSAARGSTSEKATVLLLPRALRGKVPVTPLPSPQPPSGVGGLANQGPYNIPVASLLLP